MTMADDRSKVWYVMTENPVSGYPSRVAIHVDWFFPWRIDRKEIGGYPGGDDQFDLAIRTFAFAYTDQTEQEHAALVHAERTGRIVADAAAY